MKNSSEGLFSLMVVFYLLDVDSKIEVTIKNFWVSFSPII